jgi:hypothetical protein
MASSTASESSRSRVGFLRFEGNAFDLPFGMPPAGRTLEEIRSRS